MLDFLRGHDLAALTCAWPARLQTPEPPETTGRWEVFDVTGRWAIAADGPRYHLMIDPITQQFWIWSSGGYLGTTRWLGPVRLTDQSRLEFPANLDY